MNEPVLQRLASLMCQPRIFPIVPSNFHLHNHDLNNSRSTRATSNSSISQPFLKVSNLLLQRLILLLHRLQLLPLHSSLLIPLRRLHTTKTRTSRPRSSEHTYTQPLLTRLPRVSAMSITRRWPIRTRSTNSITSTPVDISRTRTRAQTKTVAVLATSCIRSLDV